MKYTFTVMQQCEAEPTAVQCMFHLAGHPVNCLAEMFANLLSGKILKIIYIQCFHWFAIEKTFLPG